LKGTLAGVRYDLPFAGDNQFLFDHIDVIDSPTAVRWFVPLKAGEAQKETTRLTTNIDRLDASRTVAPLFAPTSPQACPNAAWIDIGPNSLLVHVAADEARSQYTHPN
jgi:CRISPR-associated protein Cas5t